MIKLSIKIRNSIIYSFLFVGLLGGCATVENPTELDPFESFNRSMYGFNKGVDTVLLKPLAQGYDAAIPDPAKQGISNFFSNLDDLPTAANQLLQGKFANAYTDLWRFLINSTFGIAGFFDVATPMGLEAHSEDFGQTLGTWGVDSGPYIVLPFLGPSTARDVVSRPVDNLVSVQDQIDHVSTRNTIHFMNLVDLRYRLLPLDAQLQDALDEYSFVRDAFTMRREYQVYDGNPPEPEDLYGDDCVDENEDCYNEILD